MFHGIERSFLRENKRRINIVMFNTKQTPTELGAQNNQ